MNHQNSSTSADAILSLISDLYSQVVAAQTRAAEAESKLQDKEDKKSPNISS